MSCSSLLFPSQRRIIEFCSEAVRHSCCVYVCACWAGCPSPAALFLFWGLVEFCSKALKFSLIPLILVTIPFPHRKSVIRKVTSRVVTHEPFSFGSHYLILFLLPEFLHPSIHPSSTNTQQQVPGPTSFLCSVSPCVSTCVSHLFG